ncbi:MAG: hypothetical protein FH751_09735 [Firmicutes bacterium]|nr:hypothetical protein [Bacillota bacterium]
MAKKSKKARKNKLRLIFIVLTYIFFIYSVTNYYFKGNEINEYNLVYIIVYAMGFAYFLVGLTKRLIKLFNNFFYKGFVFFIMILSYLLIIEGLINLIKIPKTDIFKGVYGLYLILFILSLLLFDYTRFFMKIPKRKKRKKSKKRR